MIRNILLVEPGYKTKFPPLGLMKISAYHKKLGDRVAFVKGINPDLAYEYWDRVYVSTVFTYNWDITVKTIKHYKSMVGHDLSRIFVGGILATLMAKELWEVTGVVPKRGLLSKPGDLGDNNNLIVDEMIPDYDLFDGCDQNYSLINDSYFGYATRGCVNNCDFCGVSLLEPDFIDYKGLSKYVNSIAQKYGEKCNFILFDNNVLASKKFERIIDELVELGFGTGNKYSYKNKVGATTHKARVVDFNQGTDARLLTKEKASLLGRIAINPLRIAFDHIKFETIYRRSVRYAADNNITHLSNYILYNHDDTPNDFWKRLKINIDLNKELGLDIYSFPMKYLPLDSKDRSYISIPNWNWLFLRNVQRIVNVMKGPVMPNEGFFHRAFGESEEDFMKILYMPEKIIMYRSREKRTEEIEWSRLFDLMINSEKNELLDILCRNRTKATLMKAATKVKNNKLSSILEYYLPEKDSINLKQMTIDDCLIR